MDEATELIKYSFNHHNIGGKEVIPVNSPVYHGSTILFESQEDMDAAIRNEYQGIAYGTDRLPNQRELEEMLNFMEHAELTRIFPSGISALRHLFLAFLRPGDHLLITDNAYFPTSAIAEKFLLEFNIKTDFIPADCGSEIKDYLTDHTKMIFLESPGSLTFEIQNIPEITESIKDKNIIIACDNTWATPLNFKPLDNGIDIVVESLTKYISGNSELLLGSISTNKKYTQILKNYYSLMGICTSSDDCSRAVKGLKTLKTRLKSHEKNAIIAANWLEHHPVIEKVLHPALPSHPNHDLWKKLFNGSSGLFSFSLKKDIEEEKAKAFINNLELFGKGFSFGGYKSLISLARTHRRLTNTKNKEILIRISIGLEEIEDLIKDLEHAIEVSL